MNFLELHPIVIKNISRSVDLSDKLFVFEKWLHFVVEFNFLNQIGAERSKLSTVIFYSPVKG